MRRILFSVILGLIVLTPTLTYNIWSNMVPYGWANQRFLVGDFDLANKVIPSVYYEVREWLDKSPQSERPFRIFWLPIDPAIHSIVKPLNYDTPVFFPQFQEREYTQLIFEYLSYAPAAGSTTGLGKLLAHANVKYIVINLAVNEGGGIWKHEGPPTLLPWGPGYDVTWYFSGDPKNYAALLDREERLRLVAHEKNFLIYENLDFIPLVSAYRGIFLVAPKNMINQTSMFPVYNYTNNLVMNEGFEDNLAYWDQEAGNWSIDSEVHHSEGHSLRSIGLEQGWALASQYVQFGGSKSYYLSAWMKIENAKQSHLKLLFYDDKGNVLRTTTAQVGIDGTRDWWHVSESGLSPLSTAKVKIELVGGWSKDGANSGTTWFDDISFFEGYHPIPSPVQNWAFRTMLISSMQNLMPNILGFYEGRNLLASGDMLFSNNTIPNERLRQLLSVSGGVIFLGDIANSKQDIGWMYQLPTLLFIYEAESSLEPERGYWNHLQESSLSYHSAIEVLGDGEAVQEFYVPKDSYYTIAIRASSKGGTSLQLDGRSIGITEFDNEPNKFNWYESESRFLHAGMHRLTVSFRGELAALDQIVMLSSMQDNATIRDIGLGHKVNVSSTKISTTEYRVKVESEKPTFIVVGESYDSDWNAYVNGEKLKHYELPLHMYWANVFYKDKTGQDLMVIKFDKQENRTAVITVWTLAWSSLLLYISYDSRSEIMHKVSWLRAKLIRAKYEFIRSQNR